MRRLTERTDLNVFWSIAWKIILFLLRYWYRNYIIVYSSCSEGTGSTRTDLARQLGKEGEAAAGIINPKQRIPSLSGTAKYRIPDELLHDQKILREIKNVSSQSYTNQLKDFNAWAKQNGYQFILEVRPGENYQDHFRRQLKMVK